MKRLIAVFLVLAGIAAVALGLLFLIGSAGQWHRLVVAACGLVLGGLAAGFGVRLWRAAEASSPEKLRVDILAFAAAHGGRITQAQVAAALPDRAPVALQTLADMLRAGLCERRLEQGVERYVFPSLQQNVVVRRCRYCGWEAPLSSDVTLCARCGGTVEAASATDDEAIGLDER